MQDTRGSGGDRPADLGMGLRPVCDRAGFSVSEKTLETLRSGALGLNEVLWVSGQCESGVRLLWIERSRAVADIPPHPAAPGDLWFRAAAESGLN